MMLFAPLRSTLRCAGTDAWLKHRVSRILDLKSVVVVCLVQICKYRDCYFHNLLEMGIHRLFSAMCIVRIGSLSRTGNV
jgi:hypothetical protein